jgi:hypothetical protein
VRPLTSADLVEARLVLRLPAGMDSSAIEVACSVLLRALGEAEIDVDSLTARCLTEEVR